MGRLAALAPFAIAAVVVAMGLGQIQTPAVFWQQEETSHPCLSEYDRPGLGQGTPVPKDVANQTVVTTILAVEASDNRTPKLYSIIKAWTSVDPQDSSANAENKSEILNVLQSYLGGGTSTGAPDLDRISNLI